MKSLHLLIALFLFNQGIAQDFKFGEIPVKNAKGTSYLTKSGTYLSKGATLTLGKPTGTDSNFVHITQGGIVVIGGLSGKEVKVDHIKVFKRAAFSGKAFVAFKGYGLVPCYIDYEAALESGEILNAAEPMGREEAIKRLKEARELLDLEMMTQEEYDALKKELGPIIKGEI